MVQIVDAPASGLSRFAQKISPDLDTVMERFGEKQSHKRKLELEDREEQQKREIAKALGLGDLPLDASTINAMLKEKAKEERDNRLLQTLGIIPPIQNPVEAFLKDDEDMDEREPLLSRGRENNPLSSPRSDLEDEQILGLSLLNPTAANLLQKQKEGKVKAQKDLDKEERRQFEADRSHHTGLNAKLREKISGLRESLPKKEAALRQARDAIETGNLGFFSLDKLADVTGFNVFRSAKGAQLVTASKENLLSNMARTSAKAQNQWFEQRLNSMFAQIGNKEEANLTIQAMLEGEEMMDKAYLENFDRLSDEDMEKYGYEKGDIEKRARRETEEFDKKILDRTSYQLRQIYEREQGINKLRKIADQKVPHGTPLTLEMAEVLVEKYGKVAEKMAKKLGYSLPDPELYMEFAQ